jgi:hypothetical protein
MYGAHKPNRAQSQSVSLTACGSLPMPIRYRSLFVFCVDASDLTTVKWTDPPNRKLDHSNR